MRVFALCCVLVFAVMSSPSEGRASLEEADVITAPLGVADCFACHICWGHPDWRTGGGGVSTIHAIIDLGSGCAPDEACACNPEEAEQEQDASEQVELAIDLLIQSGGEGLVLWLEEYGHHFSNTLVGSSLQVARSCGQVITWLAVSDNDAEAVRALSD